MIVKRADRADYLAERQKQRGPKTFGVIASSSRKLQTNAFISEICELQQRLLKNRKGKVSQLHGEEGEGVPPSSNSAFVPNFCVDFFVELAGGVSLVVTTHFASHFPFH